MSKLDIIRKSPPIKTYIEGVHFDFDESDENPLGPHVHYTTGAASGLDEAFLFKARDTELTCDEQEILKTLSESKTQTNKKEENMNEEVNKTLQTQNEALKAEIQALKDQYKLESITKSLEDLPFVGDQKEDVIKVLTGISDEDLVVINKAFATLIKVDGGKTETEDTSVQKAMDEEVGAEGDDEVVEKSLNQKILEARGLAN